MQYANNILQLSILDTLKIPGEFSRRPLGSSPVSIHKPQAGETANRRLTDCRLLKSFLVKRRTIIELMIPCGNLPSIFISFSLIVNSIRAMSRRICVNISTYIHHRRVKACCRPVSHSLTTLPAPALSQCTCTSCCISATAEDIAVLLVSLSALV